MSTDTTSAPVPAVQTRRSLARQEALAGYLFLGPNIFGFIVFTSLPVLAALFLSLTSWSLLTPPTFIGIGNYVRLFTDDQLFIQVLWNTSYYTFVSVPMGVVGSLLLALAMNMQLRGIVIFRALFFLPVVSMTVAIAMVWRWLYNTDFGLINLALTFVGFNKIPWLSSLEWAMPAVILMSVWKGLGFNMLIYLAGLQGIPQHLYEAAEIDGASAFARFWHITLPLLSPTTFFVLIISIISSYQVFTETLILTRGGPANATNTIVMYIYENGFQWFQMGYAAAISWVLFAIIFTVTLIQGRLQKEWVHYD
jgi:multiple sugar transport system permease protein